ncbi:MAG: zinc-ribbon domain-containing protein [Blautia sp.]|nr:zinc-ribbon domain-containing protein [Blautia sp.]
MNCPKCNAVISDNSKFCTHCGAKIETPVGSAPGTGSAVCIKCGAPLRPGAKFCAKCGTSQVSSTPQPMTPPAQGVQQPVSQPAQGAGQPVQGVQQPVSQPAQGVSQDAGQPVSKPTQSIWQPAPQPAQNVQQPVQGSGQPGSQPAPNMPLSLPPTPPPMPPSPQSTDKQSSKKQKDPAKKSKMPLVLIMVFVLIIAFMVGGYFVLVNVFDVNPIAMILGDEGEDTDESESTDESEDEDEAESTETEDESPASEDEEEKKGDPELLNALDSQAEAAKQALDAATYTEATQQSLDLIRQYMTIAEENNLKEEAGEKIAYVFDIASKATIESCKGIEHQAVGSAGFEQVNLMLNAVFEAEESLTEKGYTVDSSEITAYSDGVVQRFKDTFISQINEITEREQWSRDEAWTYAEQAYSVQKDGKTVLFDLDDLDDPLRLRYVYCLAWITRKRCENGVADGSMTNEQAFDSAVAVLPETDYNLLVLQDIITYGKAAGKDVAPYQNAYNAIIDYLKAGQNLSIVNTGVNSATTVDIRKFWYFNDLDGADAYKVDVRNGTTQATRDWIRNNIPSYIN